MNKAALVMQQNWTAKKQETPNLFRQGTSTLKQQGSKSRIWDRVAVTYMLRKGTSTLTQERSKSRIWGRVAHAYTLQQGTGKLTAAELAARRTAGYSHKDYRSWPVKEVLADKKKLLSAAMCSHFGFLNTLTILRHSEFVTVLTGNTISAAWAIARSDLTRLAFAYTVIMCYLIGQALYRVIDNKLYDRTSAAAVAPVVLVFYVLTDVLDYMTTDFGRADANAREAHCWNLLPVAVGGGCVSACSTHLDGVITNMVTGHYNNMVNSFATYYTNKRRLPHAKKKACLVSVMCIFVFSVAALLFASIAVYAGTDWQLTMLGLFVSVLLILHDSVHKDTIEKLKKERRDKMMRTNFLVLKFTQKLKAKVAKSKSNRIMNDIGAVKQQIAKEAPDAPVPAVAADQQIIIHTPMHTFERRPSAMLQYSRDNTPVPPPHQPCSETREINPSAMLESPE